MCCGPQHWYVLRSERPWMGFLCAILTMSKDMCLPLLLEPEIVSLGDTLDTLHVWRNCFRSLALWLKRSNLTNAKNSTIKEIWKEIYINYRLFNSKFETDLNLTLFLLKLLRYLSFSMDWPRGSTGDSIPTCDWAWVMLMCWGSTRWLFWGLCIHVVNEVP